MTRIDCPAELDDLKDHAVTRGRDVSFRQEGGHNPEHHTVAFVTADDPQRQHESPRPDESEAERIVVNFVSLERESIYSEPTITKWHFAEWGVGEAKRFPQIRKLRHSEAATPEDRIRNSTTAK